MRIARLDLTRYGKFTDHSIDFGTHRPGKPDLHIVFGPNEAGKSTLLCAYLDLLFGIEARSKYGFLHAYDAMQVGAAIEMGGETREFVRVKKRIASLLDGAGQPLPDATILSDLAGIDRDAYMTMFSLDDETLEKGGKTILDSRGELGQLLFQASSGLAELSDTLGALRGQAEKFHKARSRSSALHEARKRLEELAGRRKELDTAAREFSRLSEARTGAQEHYDKALAECAKLDTRLEELGNLLGVLPRLADLRTARADLAPLADLPDAPAEWTQALPGLCKQEIELVERHRAQGTALERLEGELAAIAVDPAALALAGVVEELGHLRARALTAAKDVPERRAKVADVERAIARLLPALGQDESVDAATLLLPVAEQADLRALMERRSGVLAGEERARAEHARAREALEKARAAASEAGAATRDDDLLDTIKDAQAVLAGETQSGQLQAARRSAQDTRAVLDEQLALLKPWTGTAEALARLDPPTETRVVQWRRDLDAAGEAIRRLREERDKLAIDIAQGSGEVASLRGDSGLVDDETATQARGARDAAWADHRAALDETSADAFEAALARDDAVTVARIMRAGEAADLRQRATGLAGMTARATQIDAMLEAARGEKAALDGEVESALTAAAPALAGMDPPRLREWLEQRKSALATAKRLRQTLGEAEEARVLMEDAASHLAGALAAAGVAGTEGASPVILLERAHEAVDVQARAKRLRQDVETCESAQKRRADALAKAEGEVQAWREEWAAVCARHWFSHQGTPEPDAVREILAALAELALAVRERDDLVGRIAKMEADGTAFAARLAGLAADMELDIDEAEPATIDTAVLDRAVSKRIEAATQAEALQRKKQAECDEARSALRITADKLSALTLRRDEMTSHFAVETFDEVAQRLNDLATRDRLRERVGTIEREIVGALKVATIGEAQVRLDAIERTTLERERAELKTRCEDEEVQLRERHAELRMAQAALERIGGDDAVARLEAQRQTVIAEIEEGAHGYMRLRAGILAAEQALRLYRDRHRSTMLERASAAFCEISRGAYTGLSTQAAGGGDVLIGIAADKRSRTAEEMSKGTRFQLYLALRMAGYAEFTGARAPVPFIADDILETFDDGRAEEAIRLLAGMAHNGQVICLTHHAHLCAIAERICPEATRHDLPGPLADVPLAPQ